MSNKERFRVNGNSSTILPITGGDDVFTINELEGGYERLYFNLCFFSDAERQTKVTPTIGTVSFSVIDDGVESVVTGGVFNASEIDDVLQPLARGNFESAKLSISGVDSGLYAYGWVDQKGNDNED